MVIPSELDDAAAAEFKLMERANAARLAALRAEEPLHIAKNKALSAFEVDPSPEAAAAYVAALATLRVSEAATAVVVAAYLRQQAVWRAAMDQSVAVKEYRTASARLATLGLMVAE